MAVVSTRPGIVVKLSVKFPARVTVGAGLSLTKIGADYHFELTSSGGGGGSTLEGTAWVWQVKMALASIGQLTAVDAAVSADPTTTINIAWTVGARTESGDFLYTFIEGIIGTSNATTTYNLAPTMTL